MENADREKEREALRAEEQKELGLRARGVVFPILGPAEQKIREELLKLAAIAKSVSKTEICVKVFKDGKLDDVIEPIGQYDLILQALLYRRSGEVTR